MKHIIAIVFFCGFLSGCVVHSQEAMQIRQQHARDASSQAIEISKEAEYLVRFALEANAALEMTRANDSFVLGLENSRNENDSIQAAVQYGVNIERTRQQNKELARDWYALVVGGYTDLAEAVLLQSEMADSEVELGINVRRALIDVGVEGLDAIIDSLINESVPPELDIEEPTPAPSIRRR